LVRSALGIFSGWLVLLRHLQQTSSHSLLRVDHSRSLSINSNGRMEAASFLVSLSHTNKDLKEWPGYDPLKWEETPLLPKEPKTSRDIDAGIGFLATIFLHVSHSSPKTGPSQAASPSLHSPAAVTNYTRDTIPLFHPRSEPLPFLSQTRRVLVGYPVSSPHRLLEPRLY